MDLRKQLEKGHSKALTSSIVKYVGNNPKRFADLVSIFIEGPYRTTQRAAWSIAYCVEAHKELVHPHLKTFLKHLAKPGIHDAVKRNTIRLLQFIDIPKSYQGKVAEICFGYLADTREPVAVRVFSMAVLADIAEKNAGLKPEICILIEDQMPYASAAFRSRGSKVLKKLRHTS
jgi:hypothetical protein